MGVGIRHFFIDDQGNLAKISSTKISRLYAGIPSVSFPEYKNRRVRHAEILVELENRKPVGIIREYFGNIAFDSDGRLDQEFRRQKFMAAITNAFDESDKNYKNRGRTFMHRKIELSDKSIKSRFTWTPSVSIKQAIYRAVFGSISYKV